METDLKVRALKLRETNRNLIEALGLLHLHVSEWCDAIEKIGKEWNAWGKFFENCAGKDGILTETKMVLDKAKKDNK